MKKNYIAYLQEYEGKTSSMAKQDKYRKKFVKTVYSGDKQNQHPNIPHLSSQKKKHKVKQTKHNNKEEKGSSKKSHQNSRQPTEQREEIIPEKVKEMFFDHFPRAIGLTSSKIPTNKLKSQSYSMKTQIMKLEQLITKKHQEQLQKCKMYYNWVRQQIEKEQNKAVEELSGIFERAKKEVEKASQLYQYDESYMLQKKNQTEVELELISIVLDAEVKSKLSQKIKTFSIFNLNSLMTSTNNETTNSQKEYKHLQSQQKSRVRLIEQEIPWFEGDSFALKELTHPVSHGAKEEGEGISPTFKQF